MESPGRGLSIGFCLIKTRSVLEKLRPYTVDPRYGVPTPGTVSVLFFLDFGTPGTLSFFLYIVLSNHATVSSCAFVFQVHKIVAKTLPQT